MSEEVVDVKEEEIGVVSGEASGDTGENVCDLCYVLGEPGFQWWSFTSLALEWRNIGGQGVSF